MSITFMRGAALAPAFFSLALFAPALSGQTTCARFDNIAVDNGRYRVQTNEWNSTDPQCISVDGTSFTITQANFNAANNGPATYPSIFRGCHWGVCTTPDSGMPLQVSNIGTATSSISVTTTPGSWNASYDIWFNQTATTNGQPNGTELMIWFNHSGPPQPAGQPVGTVVLNGTSWDVWIGRFDWNVISYVRSTPAASTTLDLVPFFNDAVTRQQLQPAWWLISVEAGFEIWVGGQGLAVNSYAVNVAPASSSGTSGTQPVITSVSPSTAAPGTAVTINGAHFGPSQGSSAVTFGGTTAPVMAWSDSQITTSVPSLPAGAANVAVLVSSNQAPFTVASASSTCHVDYVITNSWQGGFQAALTIVNKGSAPVNGWTLQWTFGGNQQITNLWNGSTSQSGQAVTVRNLDYKASIPAGGSYNGIGFTANVTGTNTIPNAFALNGTSCN